MTERVLMTAEDIRRAVTRIAHEVVEAHRGARDLVLIGLRTRGAPLARRLAESIRQIEGENVPAGVLDIGLYRDDLSTRGLGVQIAPNEMPGDIRGKTVVLVDDVLFTGRSVRAALDALTDLGRPQRVEVAVLVDRGHRELPIKPNYVGKSVPTAMHEHIRVRMTEVDGVDQVVIENEPAATTRSGPTAALS